MKQIICISILIIGLWSCENKNCNNNHVKLTGYWDFEIMNSKNSNLLYGICFQNNCKSFNFLNDYSNSIRFVNDLVIDGNPMSCDEIFFTYEVSLNGNKLFMKNHEYELKHLSSDSIIYVSAKSGIKFKLIPSRPVRSENWGALEECRKK